MSSFRIESYVVFFVAVGFLLMGCDPDLPKSFQYQMNHSCRQAIEEEEPLIEMWDLVFTIGGDVEPIDGYDGVYEINQQFISDSYLYKGRLESFSGNKKRFVDQYIETSFRCVFDLSGDVKDTGPEEIRLINESMKKIYESIGHHYKMEEKRVLGLK